MRQRVFLFLLSLLAVTALTACGSAEKAAEVPPLSEVEAMTDEEATEALAGFRRQDLLDAWGEPQDVSDALSSLWVDLYDAPTLGGWVTVRYDTSEISDPDTELDTLPVAAVELQTIG
ncbi:hypothetical protein KFE19_12265 [Dysosmobacter sp. Marseille-Q4140]|nr:hypothetical protein KFE19_12265 [Dysosmobacter sp. Marseille-Q4140]